MPASCRGARASASATMSRSRCPTRRAPTTSTSARSGPISGTCCASPTTARGSTTTTTRSSGTVRSASTTPPRRPAAAGCRCGRPTRPTPSASPAPASSRAHAVHRLPLLRRVVERLHAAALHDQQPVAGDRAAAPDHGSRGERLLHQPRDRVASGGRLARDGAAADLQLRQPDARHDDYRVTSATTRR